MLGVIVAFVIGTAVGTVVGMAISGLMCSAGREEHWSRYHQRGQP
jgi:hypothetical protein